MHNYVESCYAKLCRLAGRGIARSAPKSKA